MVEIMNGWTMVQLLSICRRLKNEGLSFQIAHHQLSARNGSCVAGRLLLKAGYRAGSDVRQELVSICSVTLVLGRAGARQPPVVPGRDGVLGFPSHEYSGPPYLAAKVVLG